MGNTNTKATDSTPHNVEQEPIQVKSKLHSTPQNNILEKPEIIPDYEQLKRQNSILSKISHESQPIQSFKPKKFDKEKFKMANEPYFYLITG